MVIDGQSADGRKIVNKKIIEVEFNGDEFKTESNITSIQY